LLSQSWILVVPGVREGWGLNVIEANALGVPTVAYNVPGLKDSVKNQDTGLLVENGNIQALAENLITLLEDGNKRQTLSLNALKYAKEFNWDKTANEFIAKINSL
jgi:glycosyltransferase involved in cell wall biosynthesis